MLIVTVIIYSTMVLSDNSRLDTITITVGN